MDFAAFNPPQQEAILHGEGPLLVLAGAGSGKTRVIVHRIVHLMQKRGVHAYNILAVTFTNKAAGEMKERLESLLGSEPPTVSTFHAFCAKVLRQEVSLLGFSKNFTICDDSDCEKIIKDVIKGLDLDLQEFKPSIAAAFIDHAKNAGLQPEELRVGDYRDEKLVEVYKRYQKALAKSNLLDFGDLLMFTVKIFREFPGVLAKYQERFKWVLVDEYQDTNAVQYTLIHQLVSKDLNFCVVGDDDQSIYGWRGSDIRNILEMESAFPSLKTVKLEQNYRCTQTILDAANAVIEKNIDRKGKTLWTDNGKGSKICCAVAHSEREEGQYVTEAIKAGFREGRPYSDYAVLYRVNSLSRAIEESFIRARIPYLIVGGFRFYDRTEVKDIIAYLRVCVNPLDNLAVRRVINVPARGIGGSSISKLCEYAETSGLSLLDVANDPSRVGLAAAAQKKVLAFGQMMKRLIAFQESLPPSQFVLKVLALTGYIDALQEEGTDEAEGRIENLKELVSVVADYQSHDQTPSVSGFLEHASLMSSTDVETTKDCVTLMTMHAAKGLEFPEVFIIGLEDGIFPHMRAMGDAAEMSEERRLAYVGITRAKIQLHLTHTRMRRIFGQTTCSAPSCFLGDLPSSCVEEVECY